MSNKNIKSEPIKTVLVIVMGMLVVHFFTKWKWAIPISLVIGILGLSSSYLAEKIDYLWMKLAAFLGLIMPNVLLSIIFYLFLTPIALLSRIFGEKNQLSLKNTSSSLFKDHNKKFDKASFEKMW
jgi:predicted ferric reductase